MGYQFLNFASLPSTSDYIKENYLSLPDKTVVAASKQTLGHGRLGREWLSEDGAVTFSLLVKGESYARNLPLLSFAAGEAVGLSLTLNGGKAMLKWPNDVYLGDKKAAGILLEGIYEGESFLGAAIGIGINLNQESFPSSLGQATSLYLETGKKLEPGKIVRQVLESLEPRLEDPLPSLSYFKSHDYLFGKEISLNYYGENLKGKARGIDERGRLLLETEKGAIERVSSGEASLHPQE